MYHIIFRTVRNPNTANSMQIGEVQLLGVFDPLVVTNTNNMGSGSLRNAIRVANATADYNIIGFNRESITFDPNVFFTPQTITLTSGPLVINSNVTITGPAAAPVTLDGNGDGNSTGISSHIFTIDSGTVSLSHLTLTDGAGWEAGAIKNGGTLTVTASTISGNRSGSSNLTDGGSISNTGVLAVLNSTLSGNSSQTRGGGIRNEGSATLTNCTISGNSAYEGGGIHSRGDLSLNNCTITDNTATSGYGGGIYWDARVGSLTLGNTIIALNKATSAPDVYSNMFSVTVTSKGNNLIGETRDLSGWVASDKTGTFSNPVNPQIGVLADNGGPTKTHALLANSPAINGGNNALIPGGVTTDQRGQARIQRDTVDIGAYESDALADTTSPTLSFTTSATTPTGTTPVSGSTIYSAMPTITGVAADAVSGVAKVSLLLFRLTATSNYEYWNGTAWVATSAYLPATLNPASGGENVSWSYAANTLPTGANFSDGTYYIHAHAYDKAGNSPTFLATDFKKTPDTTVPTVSFTTSATTPAGTKPLNSSTINAMPAITGVAADAGSGVAKAELRLYRVVNSVTEYWNGTTWGTTSVRLTATLNPTTGGANVSWSKSSGWPTVAAGTLTNGTYYLTAYAYDKAGKTANVSSNFKKATTAGMAITTSSVMLSTAVASAADDAVVLTFTGALDAGVAANALLYSVSVNGHAVEVQSATYTVANTTVTLLLPAGTLQVGSQLSVQYSLRDATEVSLRGQAQLQAE